MAAPRDWVVFSDDWGRFPSSSQHLFRVLGEVDRVLWVETVGMRRPKVSTSDLSRAVEKVRSWWWGPSEAPWAAPPRCLNRVAPPMHPWFGSRLGDKLNDRSLLFGVRRAMERMQIRRPRVLVTVPIVGALPAKLDPAAVVYYRVDDLALWPGHASTVIRRREEQLLSCVDGLVVTAASLLKADWKGPHLVLDHGVDRAHFHPASTPEEAGQSCTDGLGLDAPFALFAGTIDARIDWSLLEGLDCPVVLLGPARVPIPSWPHLHHRPAVSYSALPSWMRAARALLLPYHLNDQTRTIQPLKLTEYLATERPVVATPLPELVRVAGDFVHLADSPAAFAEAVQVAWTGGGPSSELLRPWLTSASWTVRARQLGDFVDRLVDEAPLPAAREGATLENAG